MNSPQPPASPRLAPISDPRISNAATLCSESPEPAPGSPQLRPDGPPQQPTSETQDTVLDDMGNNINDDSEDLECTPSVHPSQRERFFFGLRTRLIQRLKQLRPRSRRREPPSKTSSSSTPTSISTSAFASFSRPRLGRRKIRRSSIAFAAPNPRWNNADCRQWLTDILTDSCGYAREESEEVVQRFSGGGFTLFTLDRQRWIELFGLHAGLQIWGLMGYFEGKSALVVKIRDFFC